MRNQKGVTMVSLVIYIVAFSIIIGIVATVTTFFSNNISGLNETAGKSAEYNKFVIYMYEYTKKGYNAIIGNYGENSNPYIVFEKGQERVIFEKVDDKLYMNNAEICDNVQDFETRLETNDKGNQILKTKIQINDTVYSNDFTIGNNQVSNEEEFDNSESLVLGLVDDLGTRSTIYLYNNTDKITSGTITITKPDSTTATISAIADTTTISDSANYATYTVAKNGIYEFQATDGTNTTTTKIKVKNIEQFTDVSTLGLSYAKNEQKAYSYNGAAVPKGYYVDTKSKVSTGLVITDEIDTEGYSTGNEWVWVPVNSTVGNADFYINGSGTVYGTNVTYTKYSKLWQFTTNSETGVSTRTDLSTPQAQPSATSGFREPAILTDETYGEGANLGSINKRSTSTPFTAEEGVDAVATQYVTDFNNMVESVDKYGGFYIGRYEITENGEKPGWPLTDVNWYQFYNQCMTYGKENTESGMIYGSLWDATMQWLAKFNYWVGYSGQTYSGYGNYNTEAVAINNNSSTIVVKPQGTSQKLETGQVSYTRSNNIYDLSGNCLDWTREAVSDYLRVTRGRTYLSDTNDNYMGYRDTLSLLSYGSRFSSRPCLYIK